MGNRYYQEPPETLVTLPSFHQRLIECLDASSSLDQRGCHEIPTLTFSSAAKASWVSFFNHVETGLKKSNHWSTIKDFASKSAENAARLSALFHLFEGKEGSLNVESVERAIAIIQWHLFETRRILDTQPHSYEQQDAVKLLQWLTSKALQKTTPRYLQQYSPLREKTRRDKAIHTLIGSNHLQEIKYEGKTFLLVNPHALNTIPL